MIKFKYGKPSKKKCSSNILKIGINYNFNEFFNFKTGGIVGGHSLNSNAAQTNTSANRPVSQSSTLEFFQLPKKYHRKPITVDEIETINVLNY